MILHPTYNLKKEFPRSLDWVQLVCSRLCDRGLAYCPILPNTVPNSLVSLLHMQKGNAASIVDHMYIQRTQKHIPCDGVDPGDSDNHLLHVNK